MVLGFAGIFGGNARSAPVSAPQSGPVKHPQTKAASTFAPALKEALLTVPKASQISGTSGKTSATADNNSSLTLVTGLPPLTTRTTTTPSSTAITTIPPAKSSDPSPVIDALKAALTQAGVDISGMQFDQHQDIVTYPGGSYVNDLITLQAPNGRSHDYMTNLVAIAPQVTVNEIQQLMAGNRG